MKKRDTDSLLWFGIELVSLLSITFILIMFLAISNVFIIPVAGGTQIKQFGINLPNAVVTIPLSQEKTGFLVVINASNDVYIGNNNVGISELTSSLSAYIQQYGTPTSVKIAADSAASYGTIVQVMDTLRKDGISNVDFIVGQSK